MEVKVGTDGPVPSLNSKYDVIKDIPQDALVSMWCRVLQVLTAVVMKSSVFWDIAPCRI
jgi:hypothetical protein